MNIQTGQRREVVVTTMKSEKEDILVPALFLQGIEDKVKGIKESLMQKQKMLSKVGIFCCLYLSKHTELIVAGYTSTATHHQRARHDNRDARRKL